MQSSGSFNPKRLRPNQDGAFFMSAASLAAQKKGRRNGRPFPYCPQKRVGCDQAVFLARRRRLNTPAAAAPNSSSIGGAGTSVPPVEVLVLEPPELVDDEVLLKVEPEELVELDEVTLPEVDELVELDEETLPDEDDEVDE